jgi:ureidoacrylate peracid hydrolase
MVEFAIDPRNTALLGIGLQNCFVGKSSFAAACGLELVKRLNHLASSVRSHGGLVIWTRHVVRPDHANAGMLARTVPPVQAGLIDDGAITAALHSSVKVSDADVIITKPQFGAFYGTDVEVILRSRSIESVIIGGIATNICCDTTAREAHARQFQVLFLSDGTATFDMPDDTGKPVKAEDAQRLTLATMAVGFAEVLSVEMAVAKLSRYAVLRSKPT